MDQKLNKLLSDSGIHHDIQQILNLSNEHNEKEYLQKLRFRQLNTQCLIKIIKSI